MNLEQDHSDHRLLKKRKVLLNFLQRQFGLAERAWGSVPENLRAKASCGGESNVMVWLRQRTVEGPEHGKGGGTRGKSVLSARL